MNVTPKVVVLGPVLCGVNTTLNVQNPWAARGRPEQVSVMSSTIWKWLVAVTKKPTSSMTYGDVGVVGQREQDRRRRLTDDHAAERPRVRGQGQGRNHRHIVLIEERQAAVVILDLCGHMDVGADLCRRRGRAGRVVDQDDDRQRAPHWKVQVSTSPVDGSTVVSEIGNVSPTATCVGVTKVPLGSTLLIV